MAEQRKYTEELRLERRGCPRQVLGLSRSLVWTTVQIRMPAAPRRRPAAK